ncbi:hypothetical protein MKW94_020839 [Papaver nudicaule]|uniref:CCD97-like C-terminal domain-containing protein n=1 Tax=Papaver nudicaule TaxID=74823 RepID=A0AA41V6R4_PAPNU|nr:hypothetical protein [Papaver nudicaule]
MVEAEMRSELSMSVMEDITQRLSSLDNLYFPKSIQENSSITSPSDRKSILIDLLSRDTAVFLERYGTQLRREELNEFDVLKEDYEINWHLNNLRKVLSPTKEDSKCRSVTVKNRRRAYLDRLMNDGNYFSEDSMREREPYLHHEYLGKYQDPFGRSMARPGEKWSDTLMRRYEETILVTKIRGEQQRLGVDEKEWVGGDVKQQEQEEEVEEEEEEEDDEDEKEPATENDNPHASEVVADLEPANSDQRSGMDMEERQTLSVAELEDQMEQFTHIMQQKFLTGEDSQHLDYSKIDNDETLDDHWFREANHDAEEKYFAED